jgi:hypothetical protein
VSSDARDDWTGSPLAPSGDEAVVDQDAVEQRALGVPPIHWTHRSTFQQAEEVRTRREPAP